MTILPTWKTDRILQIINGIKEQPVNINDFNTRDTETVNILVEQKIVMIENNKPFLTKKGEKLLTKIKAK